MIENNLPYTPFFVVGPLRSGTTLLRLLIDHHPDINCFGEFEGAVSQARGDEWPEIQDYVQFVKSDRQTSHYDFRISPELSYSELVRDFMSQLYTKNPQRLVGASVHSRMDLLPILWPEAKYIKLFRDPRDVAKSCIGMGWVGNVYKGSKYWIEPERHWEILRDRVHSDQLLSVWYEELVSNPEAELARICEFLGCEFNPAMLELDSDTTYAKPDKRYAFQWKTKLNKRQIELVEYRCKEMMESRGYELSSNSANPPTLFEKITLTLQNRIYRVSFNIRAYGFLNWFLFVVSKKLGMKNLSLRMTKKIGAIRAKSLR